MRWGAFVFIAICLPVRLVGEPEGATKRAWGEDSTEIAEQIKSVLASDKPPVSLRRHVADGYTRLLESVGVGESRSLKLHECDSIALQAAWQEVVLEIPLEDHKTRRPGRPKLAWFHGFLEGRARLHAPQWWSEMLLDSGSFRRGEVFPGQPEKRPTRVSGLSAVRVPVGTTLETKGNSVTMRVGADSIAFQVEFLKFADAVYGLTTPDRFYVVAYNNVGAPFQLVCFDRASGVVIWKSTVWANLTGSASGGYELTVSLIEQEGRIIVFGSGTTGLFVESFKAKDGVNLFRFTTSLRVGAP